MPGDFETMCDAAEQAYRDALAATSKHNGVTGPRDEAWIAEYQRLERLEEAARQERNACWELRRQSNPL